MLQYKFCIYPWTELDRLFCSLLINWCFLNIFVSNNWTLVCRTSCNHCFCAIVWLNDFFFLIWSIWFILSDLCCFPHVFSNVCCQLKSWVIFFVFKPWGFYFNRFLIIFSSSFFCEKKKLNQCFTQTRFFANFANWLSDFFSTDKPIWSFANLFRCIFSKM